MVDLKCIAITLCIQLSWANLTFKSRRLLNLRYVDDLSAADIAKSVGSTSGAVRVLLTRARSALADCVQRRLATEGA